MEKLCCQHCGLEKEFEFFHSWKNDVKCQACYSKEYKEKHPDKVKLFRKNWRNNNRAKVSASSKRGYQLHREERIARSLEYQKNNIEKISQNKASWREKNKEKISAYEKERYLQNREEILRKAAERNKRRSNRVIIAKGNCLSLELKQTIRKPSIDDFIEYLSYETNEFSEIMKKIMLRKCDKCGDLLAMRHFAGKSNTCRKCVDPVQYAVFLEKQKEKNERFYRNNPEKTRKQYYENSKNNVEQANELNEHFNSEYFYMLFSRENFEFNYWAKSNSIDLSFLPSLEDNQFLELIEKRNNEEHERKKELREKYRNKKQNEIREYKSKWYKDKKVKNENINESLPNM